MAAPIEPVSLTIGAVALASLFTTCVQCWDYIDAARSHGRDFELLATKLEMEKTRFLIWGDVMGLLKVDGQRYDKSLASPSVLQVVERILNCIQNIFTDSDALVARYGLEPITDSSEQSDDARFRINQLSKFKASYKQFLVRIKGIQQKTSLLGKTRWALHDQAKFNVLISDLRQFIDGLRGITASSSSKKRQRDIVNEVVGPLSPTAAKLVQEASAGVDEEWSDAATHVIELSVLGGEDSQNLERGITGWMTDEDDLAREQQEAFNLLTAAGLDVQPEGFKNLHWAANNNHEKLVEVMVRSGTDVDARDTQGRTALHTAVEYNNLPMVRCLLKNGADIEAERPDFHRTPINIAIKYGHLDLLEKLLDAGANIKAKSGAEQSALHETVWHHGRQEFIRLLVTRGLDIESREVDGHAALTHAASVRRDGNVKMLLELGANPNTQADDGTTAIHRAAFEGHKSTIVLLAANGADAQLCDYAGKTMLHWAAAGNQSEIVIRILRLGVDVNAQDHDGRTALFFATMHGHQDFVRALLANGALNRVANHDDQTPYLLAVGKGDEALARILLDAVASNK